jgi:TetR/AcrR family transcriptional regulator
MTTHKEELSTEEKIKEAARKIFLQKGFAGTKIRDIAEEANINIALLNYYFRSKEKLFDAIFSEALSELLMGMLAILNDKSLSFEEKIIKVVHSDTEQLKKNPLLPNFVFNGLSNEAEKIMRTFPTALMDFENAHFVEQFKEGVAQGKYRNIHHDHVYSCMQGMILQPFIEKSMFCFQYPDKTEAELEELFVEFVDNHKQIVIDMLLNYIVIR